jgi:multimeric flavodoxin WrbA
VLGILGSPREKSNTGLLLRHVLAGAEAAGAETRMVSLRELTYRSCRHCGGCERTGECVVRDDMTELYRSIGAAQHLVLASPIQFSGVSGETKAMIDRAQALWMGKYRLSLPVTKVAGPRRGVFVATCGGSDTRLFAWAEHPVKAFFLTAGFAYWGELFAASTDNPPAVPERRDLLVRARTLGKELVSN